MEILYKPLGMVLQWFSTLFGGNFAGAVFFFTLLINLVMLPLTIKSQKSSANQARIKPKLDALKKKCGDDKVKYNQEMQELYQRENVSTTGGCLPMIIRLVIMFGVYEVITSPLRYLAGVDASIISDALATVKDMGYAITRGDIQLVSLIETGAVELSGIDLSALHSVSFDLFGLDLTETPKFAFNIFSGAFQPIWLIPIASFVTSIVSSVISMAMQKKTNPDAPNMAGMMLTMPIMSLVIAFSVPGAVGFYWAVSNLISTGIQTVVQLFYSPAKIIAREQLSAMMLKDKKEKETIKKTNS